MPSSPSSRLQLHAPGTLDPVAVPADVVRLRDQIDAVAVAQLQGPRNSRPAPTTAGRTYFSTDSGELFYDTSEMWQPVPSPSSQPQYVGTAGGPSFGAGWAPGPVSPLRFWKNGGQVRIVGCVDGANNVGYPLLFTLPVGFRPIEQFTVQVAGTAPQGLTIGTGGEVATITRWLLFIDVSFTAAT